MHETNKARLNRFERHLQAAMTGLLAGTDEPGDCSPQLTVTCAVEYAEHAMIAGDKYIEAHEEQS